MSPVMAPEMNAKAAVECPLIGGEADADIGSCLPPTKRTWQFDASCEIRCDIMAGAVVLATTYTSSSM